MCQVHADDESSADMYRVYGPSQQEFLPDGNAYAEGKQGNGHQLGIHFR